jgi:hypothetical protein
MAVWIGIDNVWFNPEQTRTTRVAIDAFLKKVGAQLWMQHDFDENAKLKKARLTSTNKVPSTGIDKFRNACSVYPRLDRPRRAPDLRRPA